MDERDQIVPTGDLKPGRNRGPEGLSGNKNKNQFENVVRASFSGPLPPPQLLREYEEICPGLADRMFKFVEHHGEHQRSIETKIVDSRINHDARQFDEARVGQILAFVITVTAIVAGVWTADHGHEIAGGLIGLGGIGGVVTTFIVGRSRQPNSESKEKSEASRSATSAGKKARS